MSIARTVVGTLPGAMRHDENNICDVVLLNSGLTFEITDDIGRSVLLSRFVVEALPAAFAAIFLESQQRADEENRLADLREGGRE